MKTLTIYGASDDLLECSGIDGADEFNVYPKGEYVGRIAVAAGPHRLNIHAVYDGSWAFTINPQDGDYDEVPDWRIVREWAANTPYSETITIDLPDYAIMTFKPA